MRTFGNNRIVAALAASALIAMGGCASVDGSSTRARIDKSHEDTTRNLAKMNEMRVTGAVVRHQAARLTGEQIEIKKASALPAVFNKQFNYLSVPQSMQDILAEIGRRTGMVIDIQQGVFPASAAQPGLPNPVGMPGSTTAQTTQTIPLDWRGTLSGLFDHLTAQSGAFWKYEEGRIHIFKTETRSFHIYLPSGKKTIDASISLAGTSGSSGSSSSGASSGSSGGGSSSGQVSVSSKTEIDAYKAIVDAVNNIVQAGATTGVSPMAQGMAPGSVGMPGAPNVTVPGSSASTGSYGGGQVTLNQSLGLLTVTTNPLLMERVETFVKNVNERFARNVLVNVKVFNVKRTKQGNAGASLSLAYENLKRNYKVDMTGTPNMSPLSGGTAGKLVLSPLPGANFTGTGLILQALEELGDVSLRTSGQVIAANGQPTPLQVARDVTYIASQATTVTPNVGSTTTITPATRTVGFTANFLPKIIGDNRILLEFQINLSEISFKQFEANNTSIQTPDVTTQNFQQQAYVRDGETIVLFGFEQDRANYAHSSGLTGVSNNVDDSRNMIVIIMEVFNGN